jgi:hypothetical protein
VVGISDGKGSRGDICHNPGWCAQASSSGPAFVRCLGSISGDEEMEVMREKQVVGDKVDRDDRHPYRVTLPGFIVDEDIGLGELVQHVTYAFRIKLCSGCRRRAATLDRWVVFTGGAR